jgi:hypothetical protein
MSEQITLEQYVQRKVKEPSLYPQIVDKLNLAASAVAKSTTPNILLVDLISDGVNSVTALDPGHSVALPTDYCRELFKCYSSTNSLDIDIFKNSQELDRCYDKNTTSTKVIGVAAEAGYLHYRYSPTTADVLELSYYAKPPLFAVGLNNDVTWLPEQYQLSLLGDYAASLLLDELANDISYGSEKRQAAAQQSDKLMAVWLNTMQMLYRETCGNRPIQRPVKMYYGSGRKGYR